MIAPRKPVCRQASPPDWHRQFLAMLPVIRDYADHAFRHLAPEGREDAVHEVVANAVVAFARLVQSGKSHLAYPTVLARYGVAQLREGRRVGNPLRIGEVLSEYAQRKKGFAVERLDRFDKESGEWIEAVVEDRRTPRPDQVAFRIMVIPLTPVTPTYSVLGYGGVSKESDGIRHDVCLGGGLS